MAARLQGSSGEGLEREGHLRVTRRVYLERGPGSPSLFIYLFLISPGNSEVQPGHEQGPKGLGNTTLFIMITRSPIL